MTTTTTTTGLFTITTTNVRTIKLMDGYNTTTTTNTVLNFRGQVILSLIIVLLTFVGISLAIGFLFN